MRVDQMTTATWRKHGLQDHRDQRGPEALPSTQCRGEWMYSRFKRPLAIRRARQLVTTSLATLGTALLFGLANHGPAVIDAVPPVG